jgi:hypothetical protein
MSKKYIKFSLANGGGGALLGSKPVFVYSPSTINPPSNELVVRLANARFPQETPAPLYIYSTEIVDLDEEQIERLNAHPEHIV